MWLLVGHAPPAARWRGWPSGDAAKVEFADFISAMEHPMTNDGLAPMEALQKADDGNFLCSLAEAVL